MERLGGEEMLFVVSELQSIINQIKVDIEAAGLFIDPSNERLFQLSNVFRSKHYSARPVTFMNQIIVK